MRFEGWMEGGREGDFFWWLEGKGIKVSSRGTWLKVRCIGCGC